MSEVLTREGRKPAEIVEPRETHPRTREFEIIDTDVHLMPEWDDLRAYMPEPYRSKLRRYPLVGADFSPMYATGKEGTGQDIQGRARDGDEVLRSMEQVGSDICMLVPGFQRPQSLPQARWVEVLASAYNDYLVDNVFPKSDRIRAELMISQRDPAAAAREIRRVGGNKGFVSVYTAYGGNYEPVGTAKHDPIFEAALENDLVVTLHAETFWQLMTPLHQGVRTWTEMLGIASLSICLADVASLIMQGAFDKYPDLRITVKEGGFWWIPEFTLRADDFYLSHPGDIALTERKAEMGETYLRRLPSEYLFDHFRFSSQPMCLPKDPRHFQMLWELCRAEDMLLYSSDWPHATYDPPNWLLDNALMTDEVRRKVFSENARSWYPRLAA